MTKLTEAPWDAEPDYQAWTDPATGLKCLILKAPSLLHLCGYVRVLRGHPMYGKTEGKVHRLQVHGGVTFSRNVRHKRHMKRGYWIGFDCAHSYDYVPGLRWLDEGGATPSNYRHSDYVKMEVTELAAQLARMK